jgi:hypothetical protein
LRLYYIDELLRDANPTQRELEGRPNVRDEYDAQFAGRPIDTSPDTKKAKRIADRRADAIAELLRLYSGARKAGSLATLDYRVHLFCERLKKQNRGKLPGPKNKTLLPRRRRGPQPSRSFKKMEIYLAVHDEIVERGGKRGEITNAIKAVAGRFYRSYELVRSIYYDRDPEWLLTVAATLELREWLNSQPGC